MLTRRNRDQLSQKAEPTPFATRAKDLGALHDAVVDAASVGAGLWLSYLFALFYFAIAAGAVTHRDLLLESPVKLPFLNVELPLKAFFILGPLVFLIVHAYVLLHFVLLASKIGAFDRELEAQISGPPFYQSSFEVARVQLRRQLPSNIFVQSLAGPREVRTGIIGFLLRRMIEISLVVGPIALLILFQLQFLPYHSEWITWWQRIAIVIDIALLWILWPSIARGQTTRLRGNDFRRVPVLGSLLASSLAFLLAVTIATFPGEWLEEKLPPVRLIPTTWEAWTLPSLQAIQAPESGWVTLHELLVAGPVNYVTGTLHGLLSNVLVLPSFEVGDRAKFDAQGKLGISSDALSLRGRSLERAVLVGAHLRKVDFTGARLTDADFSFADLREATFACAPTGSKYRSASVACAQLRGAHFARAQLEGAFLVGELQGAYLLGAQLQGATLNGAQLQGATLDYAQLQGTSIDGAQLQGAMLPEAQLQGASLHYAQLQGATLDRAQLRGATLDYAQLQGVSLLQAHLESASLRRSFVWRTSPPSDATGAVVDAPELGPKYSGLDCPVYECNWTETSYAALKSLVENSVPAVLWREMGPHQFTRLEKPPYVVDEASAKVWMDLARESKRSASTYSKEVAKILQEIGCAVHGAAYVISGLTRQLDSRFEGDRSQEAEVAAAFLDEASCPGARGLSEENKAKLQEMRDRGLPTPASPGAAAR